MTHDALRQQIESLLAAMNDSLDKQRWRRLPALHRRLMMLFAQYRDAAPSPDELADLKARLRDGFAQIIARRQARAGQLQARMEKHRQQQEGRLAYSMVNLVAEQTS